MNDDIEAQLDEIIGAKNSREKQQQEATDKQAEIDKQNYQEFLKQIESEVIPAMEDFSRLLQERGIKSEIDDSRLRGGSPQINYNSVAFKIHARVL